MKKQQLNSKQTEAGQTTPVSEFNSMEMTLSMPNTESLGKLENADLGMSRTIRYKTQEEWQEIKGVAIRCFFMGLKEIPNEDGDMVICAGFMSKDEVFLAGQMVLIDAVRSLPKNTPLEIMYEGKKKNTSSDGSTNIFSVRLLNLK